MIRVESMKAIQDLADKIGWVCVILATGCFSGYAPIASGTAGTVVAIPLYLLFVRMGWILYAISSLTLFALGMYGATKIEDITQRKDNRIIVIDEIVGYLVTMFLVPYPPLTPPGRGWGFIVPGRGWVFIILGFFVFRFFDILKPYPIRKLDQNPNLKGFGVMIDDVLAGVYGNIVLQIFARLI
jgi:phosphatidylglycerophosphatase A